MRKWCWGDIKLYPVWLREPLALFYARKWLRLSQMGERGAHRSAGFAIRCFGPEPEVECSMMLVTVSVGILESSVNTHQLSLEFHFSDLVHSRPYTLVHSLRPSPHATACAEATLELR